MIFDNNNYHYPSPLICSRFFYIMWQDNRREIDEYAASVHSFNRAKSAWKGAYFFLNKRLPDHIVCINSKIMVSRHKIMKKALYSAELKREISVSCLSSANKHRMKTWTEMPTTADSRQLGAARWFVMDSLLPGRSGWIQNLACFHLLCLNVQIHGGTAKSEEDRRKGLLIVRFRVLIVLGTIQACLTNT
ncbi:hypothetical protein DERP_010030, partial [Dermatophagoides pteronyssinus]